MKTIIVKTQAELDKLPDSFKEYTIIEIRSNPGTTITVTKNRDSSRVEAYDSSSVVAYGSSSVVAYDSSSVVAMESSRVEAKDSSRVVAYGSSSVVAYDSSSVVAYGSSSVVAYGSSSVEAYDSSSVEAKDSSRVLAYDSSSVVARGSSRVEAYEFTTIVVLSASVIITHLADKAIARFRGVKPNIKKQDETALVLREPENLEISFKTWLKRGYVVADGITKKLVSQKTIGEIEVFTIEEFIDRKESYVVKRGETFSHGETVEKAIEGLRYKLSDRDTSRFKKWKLDTKISIEDAIQAYRAITGACELGTRQFVESIQLPKQLTVSKVIELTNGKYGHDKFTAFFNK